MPLKQKASIFIVLLILVLLSIASLVAYNYESKRLPAEQSPLGGASPTTGQVESATTQNAEKTFLVTRIVDGDTFEIETKQKVRLIGIDTPELNTTNKKAVDCFAIEAKEKLSELILNKQVKLIKDISETDRYGRLLRYVYMRDDFINKNLVEQGYAYAATFPPDVQHKSIFLEAQKVAQKNSLGLWSNCR